MLEEAQPALDVFAKDLEQILRLSDIVKCDNVKDWEISGKNHAQLTYAGELKERIANYQDEIRLKSILEVRLVPTNEKTRRVWQQQAQDITDCQIYIEQLREKLHGLDLLRDYVLLQQLV